jgi:signal transduction histidine kinase
VLFNLLANAIKFTPDGGRIGVTVRKGETSVVIAVTDTGVGIAEHDLERIFQPFEQVGDPSRWSEGTGLGLSLVKRLVEAHGGAVWAESKPGQGARFTFRIPQPPRKPDTTEVLVKRAA